MHDRGDLPLPDRGIAAQDQNPWSRHDPLRVRGHAILTKAREAEDEEFIRVGEMTAEGYGEFIKIDHGQSLNSMRISDKAVLAKPVYGTAKIKYYQPPPGSGLDTHGLDKRTMKQRQTIWFTVRKYTISPVFVNRIIIHFLLGFIDEAYINEMTFQPSALPLYDGRLLTFFTDMPDKYDRCETAKIEAIAKIVFTKDHPQ